MRGEFDEYIKEWLVLGPFFPDDLETDFLADVGGEANMEPREGDTVSTSDGRRLIWKRYISETNIVDLLDAIGNYEHATAYAFCTIQSEVAGNAMFRLASDDGVAIWINGEKLYQHCVERYLNLYDENVFNAGLRMGTNLCLLKIYNITQDWEFRMRMPPPNRAVISGFVVNEEGNPITNAHVQLWWNEEEVAYTFTDHSGKYALDTHSLRGSFDLSAHSVDMGGWHTDILLGEGEYRTLNFTLKEAISIEGKLSMPDNATPHVAVPVQAIRGGKVVEVAHSDVSGNYHFVNLKPESYQLRCQVPGGYVYYGEEKARKPVGTRHAVSLQVERGRTLRNINFRFPPTIKGVWRNYNYLDGLADNVVMAIHRDPDGIMWFGTSERLLGGVSRYDGKEFVNLTTEDGLVTNEVQVICRDRDGAMWFGTRIGLSRYDGRDFTNFTMKDGLASNNIQSICCGTDGIMWFGMEWGGMSRYDGKEFVSFRPRDGLAGERVASMLCDPNGVMWFGTSRGISRYDGKEFVNLTTRDGLVYNPILSIYRDPDGALWFGTESDGASRYDGEAFVGFTTDDGLAHHTIQAIHRDPDGVIWFATRGGGVSGYDGTAWTSLDVRDGLTSNNVNLIHQYTDGSLWFATDRGINIYRRSARPPKVRIVSVTTDQTYLDLSAIPALTTGIRITIEYSAIDFKTIPEKRQYRYCIYEARGNEHAPSSPRSPASPYLPPTKDTTFDWIPQKPGEYTFQVQAIDRDLNYSEPARLSLAVQPDPVMVSMQTELNHLRREVVEKYHFENIIGHSASIRQVRALMERAIDSGLTALIIGETGTGKELVAKAIHYNSPRKGKPLLARNCGAIPKDLLASDLFGHRKGAFTGATEDKMGLFEAASGGTVLLDEISEMPEDAQIHLLRVLQEREVQRLGEYTSREVDVRIIAMTNRDLAEEVKADRFREDLYHRLNEFPIHIPPLREHSEDIPLLAEHFLYEYSQEQKQELDDFAPDVIEMLQSYTWPGNVRELRNVIRRAAALAEEGAHIQTYHFPPQITHGESLIQEVLTDQLNYTDSVTRFRRRFIEEILRECDGNRSEAARRLGMDRSNLRNLMKRLGIKE